MIFLVPLFLNLGNFFTFRQNYLDILNNNRERFYGEKLLVYNEETRQTFLNNSYKNNQIEVVGSVRFDYIHSLFDQKIDQNKIVLFHPSINAQLPDLLGKHFNFNWNEIIINFYETLNKLLYEFSNKKFILKMKVTIIYKNFHYI